MISAEKQLKIELNYEKNGWKSSKIGYKFNEMGKNWSRISINLLKIDRNYEKNC